MVENIARDELEQSARAAETPARTRRRAQHQETQAKPRNIAQTKPAKGKTAAE
jgi:hypothetical protein